MLRSQWLKNCRPIKRTKSCLDWDNDARVGKNKGLPRLGPCCEASTGRERQIVKPPFTSRASRGGLYLLERFIVKRQFSKHCERSMNRCNSINLFHFMWINNNAMQMLQCRCSSSFLCSSLIRRLRVLWT